MAITRNTRLRFVILGAVLAAAWPGFSLATTPDSDVAVIEWSDQAGAVRMIDDKEVEVDSRSAVLSPGRHTVIVDFVRGQSIMLGPTTVRLDENFEFFAEGGHTYSVRYDRVYFPGGRPRDFIWIEDADSGAIIDGQIPPGNIPDQASAYYAGKSRSRSAEAYYNLSYQAHCGESSAQYDLALFYLAGIEPIGEPDPALAYAWYERAALAGHRGTESVLRFLWEDLSSEQRSAMAAQPAPTNAVSCN
jgi:hypothetical protein